MALIPCPECGKEISDQAPACIHCGCPLPPKGPDLLPPDEPNRFSVALTAKCAYPENRKRTLRVLIDELGVSRAEAEAYLDSAGNGPVVLRSGLTQESAELLASALARAGGHVKVVDGKAQSVNIQVAPQNNGTEYIVTGGLNVGDVIVAEGAGLLREGTPINANANAAAAQQGAEKQGK